MTGRTTVSGAAAGTPVEKRAVDALLSLSGRTLPLLRQWVGSDPGCGVARALLSLATGDRWDDALLKEQLVMAHRDALAVGEREASLVYGVFLHTHRQYRLTADHLVGHFVRWPADELAGLMLGAFSSCGDAAYRAQGDALMEQQAAVAGPESWPWVSWLASTRAEQGRVREAHGLAGQALALHPRSGVAVHALAHAEHELGAGRTCTGFLDQWLQADPQAVQSRHLNWHAALQSIACGDFPDARRRADTALARTDVGMRAATNWRLLLVGQTPAGRSDPDQVRYCSPHRAVWRRSSIPSTWPWPWPWRARPTTCTSWPAEPPLTNALTSVTPWPPWCRHWQKSPRAAPARRWTC
ncbi:hypothetical protein [Streptomyces sp. JV184]|uniref:hypothetical protein n=1 Tax=Streptomyces sp. JV184 TaxID=858637 RepID=UPI002E778B99|nr:hypothetical protein [Streptomyces sp. JV184]MEE1745195.1 hypothetical protein [Streptomyces sp. JV184]